MAEFTLPNAEQFERLIAEFQRLNGGDPSKPIDDLHNAPGPKHLIAGTREAGFYGFVKPNEFGTIADLETPHNLMNGDNLALAIGLSTGTSLSSNVPWMKFSWKGKTIFTPMRPLRVRTSWDDIYQAGAVYGTGDTLSDGESWMLDNDIYYNGIERKVERVPQTATVLINNRNYIVRLIKGASTDPADRYSDNHEGIIGPNNEWNNLILPLHENAPSNFKGNNTFVKIPTENWEVNITDEDLLTSHNFGQGSYVMCQETSSTSGGGEDDYIGRKINRGYYEASDLHALLPESNMSSIGWRPVLEIT